MRQLFRFANSAPANSCQLGGGVGLMAEGAQAIPGSELEPAASAECARPEARAAVPAARRRPPVLTVTRKILLTLVGLGIVSAIVGGSMQSTRSSFTASVVNPTNSFASGTLTMKNDGLPACNTGNGVVASACGTFTLNGGTHLVPGTAYMQTITVTNAGSLPARMMLQLQNIVNGTGTLSGHVNISIHDDFAATAACLYGTAAGLACATLAGLTATPDALTAVPATIPLPGTWNVAGSLTCSATPFCWKANSPSSGGVAEAHPFTFTIEIDPVGCPGSPSTCDNWTTSFDVAWVGQQ